MPCWSNLETNFHRWCIKHSSTYYIRNKGFVYRPVFSAVTKWNLLEGSLPSITSERCCFPRCPTSDVHPLTEKARQWVSQQCDIIVPAHVWTWLIMHDAQRERERKDWLTELYCEHKDKVLGMNLSLKQLHHFTKIKSHMNIKIHQWQWKLIIIMNKAKESWSWVKS